MFPIQPFYISTYLTIFDTLCIEMAKKNGFVVTTTKKRMASAQVGHKIQSCKYRQLNLNKLNCCTKVN